MELATTAFKEVEMFTIGEFGQVVLISRVIKQTLVASTVSSVLKHFLFGKLSLKLCQPILLIKLEAYQRMKDTTAASIL